MSALTLSDSQRSPHAATTADAAATFAFTNPPWARGAVTEGDARFLHEAVLAADASTAIEVGVASGCSSAVLLKALATVAAARGETPRLLGFDIRDRCYFAPEHATGAWVGEHVPQLLPAYELSYTDATEARRRLAPDSVPFAFIDGCHLHPSPVLDFMAILPVLTPTATVVLHDVRLGALGYVRGFGPRYIAEAWPFGQRTGGDRRITVALQLPGDKAAVAALWPAILERPWETCPATDLLRALDVPAQEMTTTSEALRLIEKALKQARPLAVWGTGQAARAQVAHLRSLGIEPWALIDRTAPPTPIDGLPVRRPTAVKRRTSQSPLVLVPGNFRHLITAQLVAEGWRLRTDFVVL